MRKILTISSMLCLMAVAATPALAQVSFDDVSQPPEDDTSSHCPNGEPPDESGTCPEPPPKQCPNGEPPDKSGNCPEPPPKQCPNGESPDENGECPNPPDPETPNPPSPPQPPDTEAPDTEAPDTEAPDTEAPDTEAPDTEAPDPSPPDTETPEPKSESKDGQGQAKAVPEPAREVAPNLDEAGDEAEAMLEQVTVAGPEAEVKEAPDAEVKETPEAETQRFSEKPSDPTVASPSLLRTSAGGISALLATLGLVAVGLFVSRWIQGKSTGRSRSSSNEVVERGTVAGADAVKAFAEGRAATKATGGGGMPAETTPDPGTQPTDRASDPILLGWVPGKQRIRLLIADSNPILRSHLQDVLVTEPDFEVAGEANTGSEAVELTGELHPRVVLMDLHIPEMDGVAATAQIKATHQDTYVLIMTTEEDDPEILSAVAAGATDYLLKNTPREELFKAVRAAAQGELLLPPG